MQSFFMRNGAGDSTLSMKLAASRSLLLVSLCFCLARADAITLSHGEAQRIGHKVWQNECAGTIAGLTSWNTGENFASLGIGHFIWYPRGARGPFEESFPDFVRFAANRGAKLPPVVTENGESGCPWNSRDEFLAATNDSKMKGLRGFLAATIDLQIDFLIQRLQKALPKMLDAAAPAERAHVREEFDRLASKADGCYALIDYVNFKGEGVLDTERYHGQGWGLLQVLSGMNEKAQSPTAEFAASAARVLRQRVQNSPPERNENRWLAGWLQRVHSYAN